MGTSTCGKCPSHDRSRAVVISVAKVAHYTWQKCGERRIFLGIVSERLWIQGTALDRSDCCTDAGRDSSHAFVEDPRSGVRPNTCFMFFFSGGGFLESGTTFLAGSDTRLDARAAATAIDIASLAGLMRGAAAASLLVLDTAFPALDGSSRR